MLVQLCLCSPATQCLFDGSSVFFISGEEGFLFMLNSSGDFPLSITFVLKWSISQLKSQTVSFISVHQNSSFPQIPKIVFLPIFHVWIFVMNFPQIMFIYCHTTAFKHLWNQNHYQFLVNWSVSLTKSPLNISFDGNSISSSKLW